MSASLSLPRSVSRPSVYGVGVACFILALLACRSFDIHGVPATLMAVLAYGGSILAAELLLRVPADPRNALDFSRFHVSAERSLYKLTGLYTSFAFVALLYWLLPEYHSNLFPRSEATGFYQPFGDALTLVMPVVAVLALPYVCFVDAVMAQPCDRLYWLGRRLLLRKSELRFPALLQHMLEWVCRAYFLALLFIYADREFNALVDREPFAAETDMVALYSLAFSFALTLSMVLAVSGNALALRLTGTHIRSTDPTIFGWWVCLLCFQPFRSYVDDHYLPLGAGVPWIQALQHMPFLQGLWAAMLIAVLVLGTLADVHFGNRYGQLMHRGIITSGLYRFSKHPSYVATVLFLFITYLPPLITRETEAALRGLFVLSGWGLIYYLRARMEERHLSRDPAYVQYALWMNEHGVFRVFARRIPLLRYRAPAGTPPPQAGIHYGGLAYP